MVAARLHGLGEGGGKVAVVVAHGLAIPVEDAGVVGDLLGLHEVPEAHLGRVEAELPGDAVDAALHDEDRLRPAGAAVGGVGHLVGGHAGAGYGEVGDPVGPLQVCRGVVGVGESHGVVGAVVQQEAVPQGQDPAVAVERHLHVVDLVPGVGGADEVFPAVLDPLNRPAQFEGQVGHQNFLGVHHHLGSEPAAHVGRHHPKGLLGQAQLGGDLPAHAVGHLGG